LIEGKEQTKWRDMVLRADNGEDIRVQEECQHSQDLSSDTTTKPVWLPQPGEELCKLNGHWRILQHAVGHRWTTDDCVTAYYAVQTALEVFTNKKKSRKKLRYLDLGTGNGSVLQMTLRALLQEEFQVMAKGIEARSEAVELARRSLAFNVGPDFPVEIIHGDFRDAVQSNSEFYDYDLVTGTPPYFRVDFNVRPGGVVTSAIIREGGMPTARQSAPARCEFRGGIEAYCIAAARILAANTGRFIVCENYLNHQRVLHAAMSAKLQVLHVAKVHGKQGKQPLFCIYTMRKPAESEAQNEESRSLREETLVVRDIKGNWTAEYVHTVFRTLSIPPLDDLPKLDNDCSARGGGPSETQRNIPFQQKLWILCLFSLVFVSPLLSVQSRYPNEAVRLRGTPPATTLSLKSRNNWHLSMLFGKSDPYMSTISDELPGDHGGSKSSTEYEEATVFGTSSGKASSYDRSLLQQVEGNNRDDTEFTRNIIGAIIAVFCVAVAAGLFLGLMTLDVLDLQIIVRSSVDEDEIMYAKALLPIVKDRHRLLVTLLLMDTLAYETLPIFLDQLMSGWMAILLSTSLILVVGEILPSGMYNNTLSILNVFSSH
jgi:tRNA1(Val) A37 N6-methylase TrmN6